jgi:putative transposase
MLTATKIRLYPVAAEREALAVQFGCVRFVRNQALAMKKAAWDERKENLSCYTIKSMLPVWKAGEFPWLKDADSQALQSAILNLDVAYKNFFERRAGFPRFLRKHDTRQSIQYPQRVRIEDHRIYLPKVGWVKAVVHREIVGTIKTVTVSHESNGTYYASVLTKDGAPAVEPRTHLESSRITGIDLGLKNAVVDSHGHKSGNPRYLRTALPNLRRKQKALSRKIEAAKRRFEAAKLARTGSDEPEFKLRDFFGSNIAKDRRRVARAHERVRNARNDWQHKLSRQLADENQAVAAETLNVKGMMKNRRLSRAIADVGWGRLLVKTGYKLQRNGGHLVNIDRWFPSSKTCSCCGTINKDLALKERTWTCAGCHTHHDRDTNAARNIRAAGLVALKTAGLSVSAHGGSVSPSLIAMAAANEVGSLRLQA